MIVKGRTWKFGDNVPSDLITPITIIFMDFDELKKHVLERLRPEFPKEVRKDDIIVAGKNWGCSSGRTIAPKAVKMTGVGAVVAESFSRTFFRNGAEVGLPLLECADITKRVNDGDQLEIDISTGVIRNLTTGETIQAQTPPQFLQDLIAHGGLIQYVREKGL